MMKRKEIPKINPRKWLAVSAVAILMAGASCSTSSFSVADTDNDNRVSPAEFDRYMLEAIFAQADADGDGKVTFGEWKTANPAADAAKFKAPDSNRDGAVTPGEAKAHFDRYGTMSDLFTKIDTNSDGYLTEDEIAVFKEKLEAQSGSTPLQRLSQAAQQK